MVRTIEQIAREFTEDFMGGRNPDKVYGLVQKLEDVPYLKSVRLMYDFGYEGEGRGLFIGATYEGPNLLGETPWINEDKSKTEKNAKKLFNNLRRRTGFKFKQGQAYRGGAASCNADVIIGKGRDSNIYLEIRNETKYDRREKKWVIVLKRS